MAKPLRSKKQTLCLFAALVMGAVLVAICGAQWVQRGFSEMRIRSFSHDGTRFVAEAGHQLVGGRKSGVYDSATGDLLCDLHDSYYHPENAWSSDDKKLVGFNYGTQSREPEIVVLDVAGKEAKVLRTWPTRDPYGAFFDSQDRLVRIDRVLAPRNARPTGDGQKLTERNRLDFIAENDEVQCSVEFGLDETATLLSSVPDVVSIAFLADPNARTPDLVFTNTQQWSNAVQFDTATAEELRRLGRKHVDVIDSQTSYDYSKRGVVSVYRGDSEFPILEIHLDAKAVTKGPLAIGPDHFLVYDNIYEKRPKLFKRDEGPFDHPVIPQTFYASSTPDGEAMLFTKAGKLVRLNPISGAQRIVKDLRPNAGFFRVLAVAGIPLLWVLLFYVGTRHLTRDPFGEVAILILTTSVILVSWSWFGTGGRSVQVTPALGIGYGILTATVVFGLIWGHVSKSSWGVAVPAGIIYAGAILGVFAAWAAGDTARVAQAVMGTLLVAASQTLLLLGFRRFVGRVEAGEATAADEAHQFTLRQGLYFTGSVAVLLAVAQFLRWDGLNLPDVVGSVIFLFGFGAVLTIPATFAMWITLRSGNPIWSCLLSLLSVVAVSLAYHAANGFPGWTIQEAAFHYGPSLIVAFVVWVGVLYCRDHGFRIVKA